MSERLDPYANLAAEEWLLDRAAQDEPALFLWRSEPAVIIGKNQNPWKELDVLWANAQGVQVARRCSGGGAVYHDPGNLNYAFFMPREQYVADDVFELVGKVLAEAGLQAERTNRTSLAVEGFKVSGTAFCFRRNGAMHHGTLLVNADVDALRRALSPPPWRFETRATDSIRAHVKNLTTWNADLTMDALCEAFMNRCGNGSPPGRIPDDALTARAYELADATWVYDQCPPFTVEIPRGEDEGMLPIARLTGTVRPATLRSDATLSGRARRLAEPKTDMEIGPPCLTVAVERGLVQSIDDTALEHEWKGRRFYSFVQDKMALSAT